MQETVAGIVIGIIGFALYFATMPIWKLTEKWKHGNETEPSDTYMKVVRTIGVIMIAVGILLITGLFH